MGYLCLYVRSISSFLDLFSHFFHYNTKLLWFDLIRFIMNKKRIPYLNALLHILIVFVPGIGCCYNDKIFINYIIYNYYDDMFDIFSLFLFRFKESFFTLILFEYFAHSLHLILFPFIPFSNFSSHFQLWYTPFSFFFTFLPNLFR